MTVVFPQVEADLRREEQRKFGVFYDDDYDYLQHLKEASGLSELVAAAPPLPNRQSFQLRDDEEEEEEAAIPVSGLQEILERLWNFKEPEWIHVVRVCHVCKHPHHVSRSVCCLPAVW